MVQPVRSLRELSRYGGSLRVECRRCGRVAFFGVSEITDYFRRRAWADDWDAIGGRFRCTCGVRESSVIWTDECPPPPPASRPPLPRQVHAPPGIDERDWAKADERERKRLLRIVRG